MFNMQQLTTDNKVQSRLEIFANLPKDIKNIILAFDGNIKYRIGKYINQILHDDERRLILQTIPIKYQHHEHNIESFVSLKITHFKTLLYTTQIHTDFVIYAVTTLFYASPITGVSFLNHETTKIY